MKRLFLMAGFLATLTLAGCLSPDPNKDPAGSNYPYVGPLVTNGVPVRPPMWGFQDCKTAPDLAPVTNEVKQ